MDHITAGSDLKGRKDLAAETVVRIAGEADLTAAADDPFQLFKIDPAAFFQLRQ